MPSHSSPSSSRLATPVGAHDHILGDPHARLTLVEYGDFECPHCRIAHSVVKRLRKHLGADLRFVFRHFPLVEIHPMAEPAAEAAEFAATAEKFWPMHDAIFEHQDDLSPEMLVATLQRLSLDPIEGTKAIEEQRFLDHIEADVQSGEDIGVHGTPTFFINGEQYQGQWKYEDLLQALESA